MKVISSNIGDRKAIVWQGETVYTGIYKYPVGQPLYLGLHDVVNDNVIDRRYHGGIDKACYLYSADHYEFWKPKYPSLDWQWGMFGENLTIGGFNEDELLIGDIFKIGEAVVQITQPRQPCFKLGVRLENPKAVNEFVNAELPGAYVRVVEPGMVATGDEMQLLEKRTGNFSIKEVFHFIYNAKSSVANIKKAVAMPELAESCRKDLMKYAGL